MPPIELFEFFSRSTSVSRQKKITTPRGPEEPANAGVANAESLVPSDTKPRQWTSRSGKVLGEGTFVGVKKRWGGANQAHERQGGASTHR